jgi:hypothetical protein
VGKRGSFFAVRGSWHYRKGRPLSISDPIAAMPGLKRVAAREEALPVRLLVSEGTVCLSSGLRAAGQSEARVVRLYGATKKFDGIYDGMSKIIIRYHHVFAGLFC